MNENILFSIIIPTYNRGSLLKRCLDSVLAQTYQNWEAIIVDNYSEDDTEAIVKAYSDPRIIYIKNHNYGIISVSRNKALDLCKGDWVAFLDSDDSWCPSKLAVMRKYCGEYDLIYHGFRMGMPRRYLFQNLNNYFYEIKESRLGYMIERGDAISPSCSCISRAFIGDSRFEERADFRAVEDYDFFLQIIDKGPRIKYLRQALTIYDMSGCSHGDDVLERELHILQKWADKLTEQEKQEFLMNIDIRKAWYLRSIHDYSGARASFKKVMKSHIFKKRWNAMIEYIKCYLLDFCHYFKSN